MTAYYNEIDAQAAAWLRELIKQGHIAPGDVDERSIEDVTPADVMGYTQCHFFAGIAAWSYALRLAGWDDTREVWTGSCPCQPFSSAGKGKGTSDSRHLWPVFQRLISACRPEVVFGEQVATGQATGKHRGPGVQALWEKDRILCRLRGSRTDEAERRAIRRLIIETRCRIERKNGYSWLNALQNDLEGEDYAVGSASTLACGFGAPHKRQRLYWVADTSSQPSQRHARGLPETEAGVGCEGELDGNLPVGHSDGGEDGRLANVQRPRLEGHTGDGDRSDKPGREQADQAGPVGAGGGAGGVGCEGRGPTNGFWRDADWIFCRDGKWRPVGPGLAALASRAPARVGRLCGYGNAINAEQARAFIEAYIATQEHAMTARTNLGEQT